MIDLTQHERGILIPVRARAGGRSNAVTGIRQGALLVSVTQVAEKGKANQAIIAVLAKLFRCGKRQIELVQGAASPTKIFLVSEFDRRTVEVSIKAAIGV